MTELRDIYFLESLSDEQFAILNTFAKKKYYSQGSILFYEKEQPVSLTLLIKGKLKVYKTDQKNNEIIMGRFTTPALIAEMAVLEDIVYPASAMFETDGIIIEINFARFKKEFLHNPDVALAFFKSLSKKIKHLENVIALNVVLDATSRLAKYLYENEDILDTLKHYEVAKYLHITPETLSRTFKKLLTLDLLEKKSNGYKIKNKKGLNALFNK